MTPELYAIIGVGLALAGVLVPASNRQSRDIAGLRQEMSQQGQQVSQDIAALRQEMNQQGQQVSQDIAALRQEMSQQGQQVNQDIAALRQEINQDITGLRQEINQQGQQITQVAHQVGHLSGLLEGLRGRPIVTDQPEEIRV